VTDGEWAHVSAVLDTSGHWLLYAAGTLVGEREPTAIIAFPQCVVLSLPALRTHTRFCVMATLAS